MEKLSGYKKEEVEGLKSWKEFIPESEIEKMLEYNRKRKTNSSSVPNQYETKIITKNGDILSVLLAISQIPGTRNYMASLLDITEKKKAEEELAKQGFKVTGIDIAEGMLKLAKKQVPEAIFIKGDMTNLPFADNSFEGLISLYAIFHIERKKHELVFANFFNVLKHEGILLAVLSPEEWEGTEEYHGVPMFWSSYAPKKSLEIVKKAGFKILKDEILERGEEKQYWVFAKKNKKEGIKE